MRAGAAEETRRPFRGAVPLPVSREVHARSRRAHAAAPEGPPDRPRARDGLHRAAPGSSLSGSRRQADALARAPRLHRAARDGDVLPRVSREMAWAPAWPPPVTRRTI